jgi:hypothetical protein
MVKKSGRVLFASLLALAFASTAAWAEEEKKAEEPKKEEAKAPEGGGEFKPMADINKAFKECRKAAKDADAKKACAKAKKDGVAANKAKLKETRTKGNGVMKEVRDQMKACRKAKDKEGGKKHGQWMKDYRGWMKKVATYARKGGEAPSWDPPAKPEACAAKAPEEKKEEKKEEPKKE